MERSCVQCGAPFTAKRVTAKYCSSTCRAAASLSAKVTAKVTALPAAGEAAVVRLTRQELESVGRLETALGSVVMELAQALSDANPGTAAKAQIARQFQAAYEDATKGTKVQQSSVDELRARRDELRRKSS